MFRNTIRNILLFVVSTEALFLIFLYSYSKTDDVGRLAQKVIAQCNNSQYRPGCYDKEVPKLMDKISMIDAFQVLRRVQEIDGSYWYCHVVSHELAAQETRKESAHWKDVVSMCPTGMCSNGCIHGAFQERFRNDKLESSEMQVFESELTDVCEKRKSWSPTNLDRFSCYHALGHLLMYVTDAHTEQSVKMCERLTAHAGRYDLVQSCFDGVFMQIFQPLEPEDFALAQGKVPPKEKLYEFCRQFSKGPQSSCWSEGWPLFFRTISDPVKSHEFCARLSDKPQQDWCYSGMFSRMVTQFNMRENKIVKYCSNMPAQELINHCFSISASRFIDVDQRLIVKASRFCSHAAVFGAGDACFSSLLSAAQFMFRFGSPEVHDLCRNLPIPWQTKCLEVNT